MGLGARLHLVHPLGFQTDEKAVRRGGIDHWRHVDAVEHADASAFWTWAGERRVHLFSAAGATPYTRCSFRPEDVLLFGCESQGLPRALVAERGAYHVPMTGPVRSLNLSNAVAVVAYEAARQLTPEVF